MKLSKKRSFYDRLKKFQATKVDRYDGQTIYIENQPHYELGGYLGGGAAGVVYEAYYIPNNQNIAMKILNPIGYKLVPTTFLSRSVVIIQGKRMEIDVAQGNAPMRKDHVWWLLHPATKQMIAAYEDPNNNYTLKELTLPKCIEIWGYDVPQDDEALQELPSREVIVQGIPIIVPEMPRKFVHFARNRNSIYMEIANMSGLRKHPNILRLEEALELVQDSKYTIFLVLELATGGELFDRIKLDSGTNEVKAHHYFIQIASGLAFCHASGICHRDLKPENLLLSDNEDGITTLKIADFGLSAIFTMTEEETYVLNNNEIPMDLNINQNNMEKNPSISQTIRRLRSVVGSPHYVAPEVLQDIGQGYDGAKADAWSLGVILYAMLAGSLPFGKDLLRCLRYENFKKWSYCVKYSNLHIDTELNDDPIIGNKTIISNENSNSITFPSWFYPSHFSYGAKSLISQLLYPDPMMRLSVIDAQTHFWVENGPDTFVNDITRRNSLNHIDTTNNSDNINNIITPDNKYNNNNYNTTDEMTENIHENKPEFMEQNQLKGKTNSENNIVNLLLIRRKHFQTSSFNSLHFQNLWDTKSPILEEQTNNMLMSTLPAVNEETN